VSFTLRENQLWPKVAARVEPFGSASNFFRNPQLVKVEPKGPFAARKKKRTAKWVLGGFGIKPFVYQK
jgi:hypothetical protein